MFFQSKLSSKLLFLCLALVACQALSIADASELLVGIDPSLPPPSPSYVEDRSELSEKKFGKIYYQRVDPIDKEQAWTETIQLLAKRSRIQLKYETASSQLDFELKLAKGYFDLAYMNPLQFVSFKGRTGYKALAKRKAEPLRGLVVVSEGSDITNLRDLSNQTIVFPGLLDFQASIAPRENLKNLSIPYTPYIASDASQAYELVLSGQFPSAAGTNESYRSLPPPQREKLRIIWDTPGYTPHAFAAHSRVPFYTVTRLQRALVSLIKTKEGKKLLPLVHAQNGFEVAKDTDWYDVQNIDLTTLNNLPPNQEPPDRSAEPDGSE